MTHRRPDRPDRSDGEVEYVDLGLTPDYPAAVPAPLPAGTPDSAGAYQARSVGPAVAGIHADGVSYARGGRMILHEVTLLAAAGEVVAVTGPSGSGKSSLLALLAGYERPDSGAIHLDPPAARVGVVLQAYGLANLLTAAENVEIALQAGLAARLVQRDEVRPRAAEALAAVGLGAVADHLVEELSGGQQQRVAIARVLAVAPQVILADEFTAELDHEWKEHCVELILGLADRGGIVIVATHDPEIAARCDQVLHLVDGRAVVE